MEKNLAWSRGIVSDLINIPIIRCECTIPRPEKGYFNPYLRYWICLDCGWAVTQEMLMRERAGAASPMPPVGSQGKNSDGDRESEGWD